MRQGKTWVYCIVRTDIPLEQQIVQSGHAALEAGLKFPRTGEDPSSLIVLKVGSKPELMMAQRYLDRVGIKNTVFFEPDWDYKETALATEPLTQDRRHLLKSFKLWSHQ